MTTTLPPPKLLTAEELAERLSIRPDTVRVWARLGHIPRVVLSPKVVRYDYAAVVEALRARQARKLDEDFKRGEGVDDDR